MSKIDESYRRVLEEQVDAMLHRHFSAVTPITNDIFKQIYPDGNLRAIVSARSHRHKDYRRASGDELAFGETDIEVVAVIDRPDGRQAQVALLLENKVDADQMEAQGLRYQARAKHEMSIGSWQDFRCVLVAPKSYIESHYPSDNFADDGWDGILSYENLASVLRARGAPAPDHEMLIEATTSANTWNKPIPSAVQFWKDYSLFQRAHYPAVPVFIDSQKGSRAGGVWPSFYDNQLRNNSHEPRRKRVQIVHVDNAAHLSLFIKRVEFQAFAPVVLPLLEDRMLVGSPGGSWQSVQIRLPAIDPQLTLESQTAALDEVFIGAQRLHDFYIRNEIALLCIPVVTKVKLK